jgi:hypothetical protein
VSIGFFLALTGACLLAVVVLVLTVAWLGSARARAQR